MPRIHGSFVPYPHHLHPLFSLADFQFRSRPGRPIGRGSGRRPGRDAAAIARDRRPLAYGINLNDGTHIPGGGVSGPSLIRPDLPELKEPFPFLWQQAEYVLTGEGLLLFFPPSPFIDNLI
jgi:hypothetical protein